jgi:hypothetical protein
VPHLTQSLGSRSQNHASLAAPSRFFFLPTSSFGHLYSSVKIYVASLNQLKKAAALEKRKLRQHDRCRNFSGGTKRA